MNKKGFTLVEIIAVIALIGALLLLVVPSITSSYKKAQKNLFYDNVISIYNSATTTYLYNADEGNTSKSFCHSSNPLNIDVGDDIKYSVTVDNYGAVNKITVSNGKLLFTLTKANMKKSDIKKDNIEESTATVTCEGISYSTGCIITDTNKTCRIYSFDYLRNNYNI